MIDIIIERWIDADGKTDYLWSIWGEGHRIAMGSRKHANGEDCEHEALAFCRRELGRDPDTVTRL